MVYIYNWILLIHIKGWNSSICNNVDGTREYYSIMLSENSQRKANMLFYHLHVIPEKQNKWMNIKKTETGSQIPRLN